MSGATIPWLLSGVSDEALREQARVLHDWVEFRPELGVLDIGSSLASLAPRGEHRAAILGEEREQLLAGLAAMGRGEAAGNLFTGQAAGADSAAFVFPGQGTQWAGMALELLDDSAVFRERIEACDAALGPYAEWSLLEGLRADPGDPIWGRVDFVQSALFATMYSLFETWRSFGVEPSAVVGQSIGEAAAACAAGALELEDAARLAVLWARAQVSIPTPGLIASIAISAEEAERHVSRFAGRIEIAGINGPHACAVSGEVESVRALLAELAVEGIHGREIDTAIRAVHSSQAEAVRARIVRELAPFEATSTRLPFYSSLHGERLDTAALDSAHWAENVCRPVLFERAVRAALGDGQRVFVEVSPHPALVLAVEDTGEAVGAIALASLQRGQGGLDRLIASLAEAHVCGVRVDWPGFFEKRGGRRVEMPTALADAGSVEAGEGGGGSSFRSLLLEASEERRRAMVVEMVQAELAILLGLSDRDALDVGATFRELGLDSAAATELRSRLGRNFGLRLPAAIAFDFPSVERLAGHLCERVEGVGEPAVANASARLFPDETIAVVGIACRFPGGVDSPDGLWRLVAGGRDAITEFPEDRGWDIERIYDPDPDRSGTTYAREGGFLHDVAEFDAGFFGIGPREALAMDPQQRLLLECAWEALEDAGIDPKELRGSATGVFAGFSSQDYGPGLRPAPEDARDEEAAIHRLAGTLTSVISGRVAYALGLEGPAVSIDTACSSSLVAMHLAAQALRGGECDLALAGGVTVMASPGGFIEFCRSRGLSPDGRCKSFDASADGTGWSEGSGLVLLQRLSDAEVSGRRIHAVIRGSAVNQDGASNGLTAPNGPSQERVIRQALANAGLKPGEVDAVEAHGTGTTLGDPIEAQALLATYGQDRDNGPLALGSLKSNIGHTVGAAGVGGVIKMAMALREEELPRTIHLSEPTPHVDWEAGEVELLREAKPWPRGERVRRAAISSFGISGTNAHLILEEPPEPTAVPAPEKEPPAAIPWALSAKTPEALAEAAKRLTTHIQAKAPDPLDVSLTLLENRAQLAERAVVVGAETAELLEALAALAEGGSHPGLIQGRVLAGKSAFLFSGQGSQRAGMGKGLHEAFGVYAESFDRACEALGAELGIDVREAVFAAEGTEAAETLHRTDLTQAATFALQVALFDLLASFGLSTDYLIGHSIGEISAAHLAGVFDLGDAAKLVAARGSLMAALPGGGAMAAIRATEAEVEESLVGFEGRLGIAAVNSPTSIVVSGEGEAIELWRKELERAGQKTRPLKVSHAFHSHLMEPMLARFEEQIGGLSFKAPQIPVLSNLTGELLSAEQAASPAYWASHIREPVRFGDGIAALAELGVARYLELGPDATLTALAAESLPEPDSVALAPSLRRGHPEPQSLIALLAAAHAAGAKPDFSPLFEDTGAATTDLPTYPFQRQRYWLEASGASGDAQTLGLGNAEHPLLGASIALADGSRLLTGRLSLATHPWLADHALAETPLLPGTAFVELALRAGEEVGATHLSELLLEAPLLIPQTGAVQLQLSLEPAEEDTYTLAIHSRPQPSGPDAEEEAPFTRHASATLTTEEPSFPADFDATSWPPPAAEPIEIEVFYSQVAAVGLDYGPAFQGLEAAWKADGEIYAEVSLAPEQAEEAGRYAIHPALLDAALHPALLEVDPSEGMRLPFSFSGLSATPGKAPLSLRVCLHPQGEGFGFELFDQDGSPLAQIASLTTRPLDPSQLRLPNKEPDSLFDLRWVPTELAQTQASEPEVCIYRPESRKEADPAKAAHSLTASALEEIQAFLSDPEQSQSRLAILTEGAIAQEEGESPDLPAAALWGLIRSAQSEHPGRLTLIDTDQSEASKEALPRALAIAEEPQIALREGEARVPRLSRAGSQSLRAPEHGPWCLAAGDGGTLEGLSFREAPEAVQALEPDEVRVSVRAAGLNFRDVLIALGVYPGEASIGSEGAGVVVEVGSEVEQLKCGDRVFGLLDGAFGPLARAEQSVLAPLPPSWSFTEGASVPIVFATAYYGLIDLAALKAGERVLIHSGAGGVGMAAIQIAHHLGAEVFATASPRKWEALRDLGLDDDHIASSRDLEFRDKFLRTSEGAGMDVVLDALAREFVDASLQLLPNGGRFVEMGKADVREPDAIAAEYPGVSYRAFDLAEIGGARTGEIFAELLDLFARGALAHAPISSWDIRRGIEAFRFLSQARHTGKVVLTLPRQIDPDGTVLITAGLTGLGALTARHLADKHGAKHLLLLSRRGPEAPGAAKLLADLAELGCEATALACDVSDRAQLEEVLAGIPAERPLCAAVHCAGVLEDALIADQSGETLDRALAPKADAAWHLHELTRDLDLDAFVLFSSAAATLGNPGQGNYAAANAFMDALAQCRHAQGEPATAIAWGLWERESVLTAKMDAASRARLARGGLIAIGDGDGLELFDRARTGPDALAVAVPMEVAALSSLSRAGSLPPLLAGLVRAGSRRRSKAASGSLSRRLAGVSEAEREEVVLNLVREEVAAVLGHASPEAIDADANFKDLGFDSLGAVELRNRLAQATGMRLKATLVFDHPSSAEVGAYLLGELGEDSSGRSPIYDDLDRLEATLARVEDAAERDRLTARIRAFNARLTQLWGSAGGDPEGELAAINLDSASDDELFELIDKELGAS